MRFPSLPLVAAAALFALGCAKDTTSPAPANVPTAPAPADLGAAPAPAALRQLTLTYFTMAG